MPFEITPGLLIIAFQVALFILLLAVARRYKKVGPNQALVISGGKHMTINPDTGEREVVGFRIATGGGAFVWPLFEHMDVLSLEVITAPAQGVEVYTVEGKRVQVDAVLQLKIGSAEVAIRAAAEHFLSKSREEIAQVAREILSSHLQIVAGATALEELDRHRAAIAERVKGSMTEDLGRMGLEVVSCRISGVREA